MAVKQVIVSDVSGREVTDAEHARIVITDHPQLRGAPVELDVSIAEAHTFQTSKIDLVTLEIHEPGRPRRHVVMEVSQLDALFGDVDMDAVVAGARTVSPPSSAAARSSRSGRSGRGGGSGRSKTDYTSSEHAGSLHRGRVTEAEAQYVRTNLDEVNARLGANGERVIDPADPKERSRYGF